MAMDIGKQMILREASETDVRYNRVASVADQAAVNALQLQNVMTLDPQGGVSIAKDTLVTQSISFPEWRNGLSGGAVLSTLAAQFTIDTLLDADWLNAQQTVAGDIAKSYIFTPPPGTTSLTWVVPMQMPVATGTKNVTLRVYNGALTQLLTQTQVVTTSAVNRVPMSLTGLAPGTFYILAIHCNESGQQANPYVGQITLVPNGATGVFASSFRRLRIGSSIVAGNIQTGWNNGVHPFLSPNADILFNTNATQVAVESYAASANGTISALYAGDCLYNGNTITNGNFGYDTISLPYADEPANVTIRTGTGSGPINGGTLGYYAGAFVRAIYVPSANSVSFIPFTTRDLCIGVGDSLILGNSSGDLPFQSWSAIFRRQYSGNFALDAHNSRQLFQYAGTPAQQDALAKFIGRCNPKLVIWDLSVNDFVSHPWPGGSNGYLNFVAAQANIIDLVHDRYSPQTRHIIKTATRLTTETDQGNGTMAQFRTGLTGIATGRASYVIVVDGTSLMTAGDIDVDGIHMTTTGQSKVGSGMIAALAALVPPEV